MKAKSPSQREFNLMDYEQLRVDFTGGPVEFDFTFYGVKNVKDGATADLFVHSTTSQVLNFGGLPVPKKAKAKKLHTEINIPKGESFAVLFTLDDQPLFIVRIDQDYGFHVSFKSYDLAGNEMSNLYIGKPDNQDEERAKHVNFFKGYPVGEFVNDLWGRSVHGATLLFEFVDMIIQKGSEEMADDLEDLRFELFKETRTMQAAYRLYQKRHELKGSPDLLIDQLIAEAGSEDEQKGAGQ